MHLDIYYVYVHNKINVSRKAKTTNNLGRREYHLRLAEMEERTNSASYIQV